MRDLILRIERSLKQHKNYFNFRSKIQLDHPVQPLSTLSGPGFRSLIHSLDPNLTIHPPLFYLSTWHDEVNAFVRSKIREHRDDMVAASFST